MIDNGNRYHFSRACYEPENTLRVLLMLTHFSTAMNLNEFNEYNEFNCTEVVFIKWWNFCLEGMSKSSKFMQLVNSWYKEIDARMHIQYPASDFPPDHFGLHSSLYLHMIILPVSIWAETLKLSLNSFPFES